MSLMENMNTSPSLDVTNAVKPAACSAKRESGKALCPVSLEMRWKTRHGSCSANEASPAAKTWPDTKATMEKLEPHAISDILCSSTPANAAAGTCNSGVKALAMTADRPDAPPESSCGTSHHLNQADRASCCLMQTTTSFRLQPTCENRHNALHSQLCQRTSSPSLDEQPAFASHDLAARASPKLMSLNERDKGRIGETHLAPRPQLAAGSESAAMVRARSKIAARHEHEEFKTLYYG